MSTIRANTVTDAAGTGSPNFPNGLSVASAALTGVPTAPTASVATNTTQIATTAFVLANVPAAGGMTLLGTLTTTSGSTVTLSGLTLTSYQQVMAVFKNVSATSVAFFYLSSGSGVLLTDGSFGVPIANGVYGTVVVDLTTAVVSSNLSQTNLVAENNANVVAVSRAGIQNTVTSASTSISFFASAGTFDNGSIRIYGVK